MRKALATNKGNEMTMDSHTLHGSPQFNDFKKYQEGLLEHLRESITSTYKKYEPDATHSQEEMLFSDREFRNLSLSRMETTRSTRSLSETPAYWQKFVERFRNYDQLKIDLLQTECSAQQ